MTIRNLLLGSALTFVLTACSKDPAEKIVVAMEDMGDAIDSAKGDCGKMADNLEAISKKHDFKQLKAEGEKLKASKADMKKYEGRLQKVMPKLMGAIKCADDPKMKAASAKLGDLGLS